MGRPDGGHRAGGGLPGEGIRGVPVSQETVVYRLSPLAARQWEATMDWADAHGRIEVALHAVGVPRARCVLRLECGPQWVSAAACHNEPTGVVAIGQRAAAAGLHLMGQVHHHPFYGRARRAVPDEATFFLSQTDWRLLEQLSGELAPGTVVFEPAFRPCSGVVVRTTPESRLSAAGRCYALPLEPGTEVRMDRVERQELTGHAEAFVAVTGSDRALPHGYVLRGEICTQCAQLGRRRVHEAEFRVAEDCGPEYSAEGFDEGQWGELLRGRVRRGAYWAQSAWATGAVYRIGADDGQQLPGASPCGEGWQGLSDSHLREELQDRLEVLGKLLPPGSAEAAVAAELREMLETRPRGEA